MKVLQIISSPAAGGAELYVKDLSKSMVRKGHSVHIMFMYSAADIGRCVDFENKFLDELRSSGVEYSFIGNDSRVKFYRGIQKVKKYASDNQVDVIHSHLTFGLFFSIFSRNAKRVYTHHNIKVKLPKILFRALTSQVDSVVGICSACSNLLRSMTSKRKVVTIYNTVSEDRIKPKLDYRNCDSVKVAMVGHISEQKNYRLLLDVINKMHRRDFVVYIAGEGPDLNKFKNEVEKLGFSGFVHFLGNVNDIPSLLNESDIFAMTSSWEGLPIALIEATLTRLPTIVTDVGGCAEITHNVVNGFVVEPGNVDSYHEKLELLISSYELRKRLHVNSKLYPQIFNLESAVAQHLELYRKK